MRAKNNENSNSSFLSRLKVFFSSPPPELDESHAATRYRAAFAYERFVAKKIPYYGMQCGRKEERLAEMFSNIFTAVVDSIKKPTGGSKNV